MMENKPVLGIEEAYYQGHGSKGTLGANYILKALINSNVFNIEWHDDRIKPMRGERATIFHFNGKRIYLDFWEYPTPTHTVKTVNENFDLIIKLQHKDIPYKRYNRYITRKAIMPGINESIKADFLKKIVPWTFFPSRMMLPLISQEVKDVSIEREGFFCGKAWKTRGKTKQILIDNGFEVINSSQEKRSCRPLSDNEYLHRMRSSKYGIVMQGRGSLITDVKNRREIDYMILRKPILMSYKPFYYDPLIPGEHYIYFNENTDFSKLEDLYNIEEIEKNAYKWYLRNVTEKGIANTLLKIFNENL